MRPVVWLKTFRDINPLSEMENVDKNKFCLLNLYKTARLGFTLLLLRGSLIHKPKKRKNLETIEESLKTLLRI